MLLRRIAFQSRFISTSIYSIKSGIASISGVATGRYPEDIYYNGNVRRPLSSSNSACIAWYLTTLAVAVFDALIASNRQGSITIISQPFFSTLNISLCVDSLIVVFHSINESHSKRGSSYTNRLSRNLQ